MFSRPVGRAACAASTKASSLNPVSGRTAVSQTSRSLHQRRRSSSKTSHPPGGTPGSEAATSTKSPASAKSQVASQQGEKENKQPTRLSRRKPKDPGQDESAAVKDRNDAYAALPTVKPTSHLKANDVHTSAFFSLNRPLSITHPFPPHSSQSSFDSIFEDRPRTQDVIYTIGGAVSALEGKKQESEERDLRSEILRQSSSNSDSAQVRRTAPSPPSLEDLVAQCKPFNTPPVPLPMDENLDDLESYQNPQAEQEPAVIHPAKETQFTAKLTITEHTLPSGEFEYTATHGPFVEHQVPRQPSPSRLQARQEQIEEWRSRRAQGQGDAMHAISVKRQRKLKMKKHKYKKLMRRTRNLRRREGRA